MAETVREIMSSNPQTVSSSDRVAEVARMMRDNSIGDVLVSDDGSLTGIITDRDIVVRVIAEGRDPDTTPAGDVCTKEVHSVSPEDALKQAVSTVREHAVRRVPVVEDGRLVGIVSLGDIAIEKEETTPLADVSAAPPNK